MAGNTLIEARERERARERESFTCACAAALIRAHCAHELHGCGKASVQNGKAREHPDDEAFQTVSLNHTLFDATTPPSFRSFTASHPSPRILSPGPATKNVKLPKIYRCEATPICDANSAKSCEHRIAWCQPIIYRVPGTGGQNCWQIPMATSLFASIGRNEDFLTMLMVAPSRGDSNEILEAKRAVNA